MVSESILIRVGNKIELCQVISCPISPSHKTVRVRLADGYVIKRHLDKHVVF